MTAGLFPGQGSQYVGMGQELATQNSLVRETFAEADAVLGFSLSALCFAGPAEELKRTSIAQPALVTISTALWRVLAAQGMTLDIVAGHSLGEYSALVAAGALQFADALRLVRRRGEVMEEAAAAHPGGMAAVLTLDDAQVEALCREISAEHGVVVPANYNAPGQVVVSGESAAIAALRAAVKARGGKAIPLAVSGPFHSPLMQSASEAFAAALAAVPLTPPTIPIVPNVTAAPTTEVEAIRTALARQITGSVQWVRTLYAMRDRGVQRLVEIGPGNVLTGLAQRTVPEIAALTMEEALGQN
jgi:[acyl-carrier-protein] S-malonyltransferase